MELLTPEIRAQLPKLYAQDGNPDVMDYVKFFTPDSSWTWFATEFAGIDQFFGLFQNRESEEFTYFSLSELQNIKGPRGLRVERDLYFTSTPIAQLRRNR